MNPLTLNPLPGLRSGDDFSSAQMEREGFVDEAVVTAMLARPYMKRSVAYPEDLALAADDQDFAGWSLPTPTTFRDTGFPSQAASVIAQPVAAPAAAEPEEDQPQSGNLLWWLAGLACVLSVVFFSAVLFTFTPQSEAPSIKKGSPPAPATVKEEASLPGDADRDPR
jgi:hypothetical protein